MSEALAVRKQLSYPNIESVDSEACWQAVLERDRSFDGRIFFGVRSTGIYCRPSCPARRPRREQVVFFRIPEAAERAGFRSCRRCRPRNASITDPQVEMVRRACLYIETHFDESPTLDDLSTYAGVSPYHLQHVFKRIAGITPRQYAEATRLDQFKTGVRKGATVTGAMYDAGYGSSSRLYERAPATRYDTRRLSPRRQRSQDKLHNRRLSARTVACRRDLERDLLGAPWRLRCGARGQSSK